MFQIGDTIRMRYTGLFAEIVEDHLDGSYTILDEDDDEIIAFVDDIVLSQDFQKVEVSEIQKKLKKKPKKKAAAAKLSTEEMFFTKKELAHKWQKTPLMPTISETKQTKVFSFPKIQPIPPSQQGCFLAFLPINDTEYSIYLINDTSTSFSFEFRMFLQQELKHGFDKIIPANDFFAIGEFKQEQFNDSPTFSINFPRLNFQKDLKLKYKKFVSQSTPMPLIGLDLYGFCLFSKVPQRGTTNSSLRNYTEDYHADRPDISNSIKSYQKRLNLMAHASFDTELDLHAEKLVDDTSKFTVKELFEIQLQVLDNFIQKATELSIKKVYIIHGIGKGKLKKEVANFLRYKDCIKSFKNEYHDKYGFGATIVEFN